MNPFLAGADILCKIIHYAGPDTSFFRQVIGKSSRNQTACWISISQTVLSLSRNYGISVNTQFYVWWMCPTHDGQPRLCGHVVTCFSIQSSPGPSGTLRIIWEIKNKYFQKRVWLCSKILRICTVIILWGFSKLHTVSLAAGLSGHKAQIAEQLALWPGPARRSQTCKLTGRHLVNRSKQHI